MLQSGKFWWGRAGRARRPSWSRRGYELRLGRLGVHPRRHTSPSPSIPRQGALGTRGASPWGPQGRVAPLPDGTGRGYGVFVEVVLDPFLAPFAPGGAAHITLVPSYHWGTVRGHPGGVNRPTNAHPSDPTPSSGGSSHFSLPLSFSRGLLGHLGGRGLLWGTVLLRGLAYMVRLGHAHHGTLGLWSRRPRGGRLQAVVRMARAVV